MRPYIYIYRSVFFRLLQKYMQIMTINICITGFYTCQGNLSQPIPPHPSTTLKNSPSGDPLRSISSRNADSSLSK